MLWALMSLASLLAHAQSVTIEEEGAIGKALNIPNTDILSKALPTEGLSIIENITQNCIIDEPKDTTKRDDVYFSSTRRIYADLGTTSNIEHELRRDYTLKTSLNALTNSITAEDPAGSVQAYVLRVFYFSLTKTIFKECLNNLNFSEKFLKTFKALPEKVEYPEKQSSWYKYSHFINTYGTHLVKSVTYGSSIHQYSFARASNGYKKNHLRIKACEGLGKSGEANITACEGITDVQRAQVNQYEITTTLVVRGGSKNTRAELLYNRTKDVLTKFRNEAKTAASPIEYSFVPIWELLRNKFYGTPDFAKAKNLEEYFKGFLNFGCDHKEIDGKVVQVFARDPDSSDEEPAYQCNLRQQGCLTDKDCHWSFMDVKCSCNGLSCIEYKRERRGDGSVRNIPYAFLEKRGVSRGCGYKMFPAGCVCKKKAGFGVIWPNKMNDEPEKSYRKTPRA